ncbi:MAG: hypothetical protein HZA93_05715 [Verrucomicrobia bacterium]|nr:hypothetical protein [Verrucomicrobiota bacterium]
MSPPSAPVADEAAIIRPLPENSARAFTRGLAVSRPVDTTAGSPLAFLARPAVAASHAFKL